MDGCFLNVCFGGTSRGGDGRRFPELASASVLEDAVVLADVSLSWLMLDQCSLRGGTGWLIPESVFVDGVDVEGIVGVDAPAVFVGALAEATLLESV